MDLNVYGHKMQVTEAIQEHINSNLTKLEKFNSFISSVNLVLEVQNDQHVVKCITNVPHHNDLHAVSTTDDMYSSIDSAFKKIENQLRKIKGIKNNITHTKDPNSKLLSSMKEADELEDKHRGYDDE